MGRMRKDCSLYPATDLLRLSNHLVEKHGITSPSARQQLLQGDGRRKRRFSELESDSDSFTDDDIETEDYEDDDDDAVSDEDDNEVDEEDDADSSNEEEEDLWSRKVTEVFDTHRKQMEERYQELKEGLTKNQAFEQTIKEFNQRLEETFQEKCIVMLKEVWLMRNDPTYRKIHRTIKRLLEEDDLDYEEAIHQAVETRKLLFSRIIKQWKPVFSDADDDDDDADVTDDDNVEQDIYDD